MGYLNGKQFDTKKTNATAAKKGDYVFVHKSTTCCKFNSGWIGEVTEIKCTVQWMLKRNLKKTTDKKSSHVPLDNLRILSHEQAQLKKYCKTCKDFKDTSVCCAKYLDKQKLWVDDDQKMDRRRRMAQREFSNRRDSPVMVRLLQE